MIEKLQTAKGIMCTEEAEVAEEIANFFENLFITDNPQDCAEIFEGTLKTISESMNRNLIRPVED